MRKILLSTLAVATLALLAVVYSSQVEASAVRGANGQDSLANLVGTLSLGQAALNDVNSLETVANHGRNDRDRHDDRYDNDRDRRHDGPGDRDHRGPKKAVKKGHGPDRDDRRGPDRDDRRGPDHDRRGPDRDDHRGPDRDDHRGGRR
ncbi:MAG: hypothetical protein LBT86_00100 [Deltaproteobacteria bacterium]|nr:hypothetical protein [Deltaproteobacteria bacterium]